MAKSAVVQVGARWSFLVRQFGKNAIGKIAPSLGDRIRSLYWDWRLRGGKEALAFLKDKSGLQVLGGPFKGMRLIEVYSGSSLLPKVVGSYEDETTPAIEGAIAGNYDLILDIGSAEGYFVVGLAKTCPDARVIGYDINEGSHAPLMELAKLNGVEDRVEVHGSCTHEVLSGVIAERTFIVCDIEGAERELLDPVLCPALLGCDLLVEMHNKDVKDTGDVVKSRFAATHDMEIFTSRVKDPQEYPCLEALPARLRQVALDEMGSPGQERVWFRRKS